MRFPVSVDEDLMEEAMEALGVRSKSEAVRLALREVLRHKRLERALEHRGAIDLDLDEETLRRLRKQG